MGCDLKVRGMVGAFDEEEYSSAMARGWNIGAFFGLWEGADGFPGKGEDFGMWEVKPVMFRGFLQSGGPCWDGTVAEIE
jgi:hypothetical protein